MPEINNLKMCITGVIRYEKIREFCEFALEKGYEDLFVDNGNIVFQEKTNDK
jgi:hypothetical protein